MSWLFSPFGIFWQKENCSYKLVKWDRYVFSIGRPLLLYLLMNSSVKYHGHRIFVYFKGSPNIYIDDYTIASKSIRRDTVFTYPDLYLYGIPVPLRTILFYFDQDIKVSKGRRTLRPFKWINLFYVEFFPRLLLYLFPGSNTTPPPTTITTTPLLLFLLPTILSIQWNRECQ